MTPLKNHRAERTWEHDIYFEMLRDDDDFNPNRLLPSLFWEIPFTAEELLALVGKVTDVTGAKLLAQHPSASYAVKAKLYSYLSTDTPEVE